LFFQTDKAVAAIFLPKDTCAKDGRVPLSSGFS
jgi:hypothetical protein